jgi:hypothetical protein
MIQELENMAKKIEIINRILKEASLDTAYIESLKKQVKDANANIVDLKEKKSQLAKYF